MRKERLIATIRFPVPADLSIDALIALADPRSDRLDGLLLREAVSDSDPVVLVEVAATDRCLNEVHAPSIDEPKRSAAQRHTNS
jgi:hypothetical protein